MELGIYEQVINQLFEIKIKSLDCNNLYIGTKEISKDNVAFYLSQYLYHILQQVISSLGTDDQGVEKSINLVNGIITKIADELNLNDFKGNLIDAQSSILTAVIDKTTCEYPDISEYLSTIRPITSLVHSSLFTGSNGSVDMLSELRKEIMSCDEICLLVSFIKRSGLILIYDYLKRFTANGHKLKVITTTYMGASDFSAIKQLSLLPNTSIKISYNSESDRLHAKAYLFIRNSGFHTSYIGSSNLSEPALTKGLEWNIKVTQTELPDIISSIRNSFNTYWEDTRFETFSPGLDDKRLKAALNGSSEIQAIDYSVLDLIHAHNYQEEILEKLRIEREIHHHYKNLVVAATGTGKTVIAAFDFKRYLDENPNAKFLFVVHREEIIKQACSTFRAVLRDENFGEMWYGSNEPSSYTQLFASKDMLNNRLDQLNLPDTYYDYIIFDEAHHIVADTYQKIIHKFKPNIFLGLTATPERMDGQDILKYFDDTISAEIRLDTALNNNLLCPFHYYGITDNVDLNAVKWERGHYDVSELSHIYRANDRRTSVIFSSLEKYLPDYDKVSALCFCVDIEHAKYMQAKFTLAGLKSQVLTSDNSENRARYLQQLKAKTINYLFVVDMFNEGVDIPSVDTILFLRPTESLTIFIQQLGRGLRKETGKDFVTVLDYVGHCKNEFNYVDRFRSLIGKTSMSVSEEFKKDFPHLPLNCKITLEPKAKEYILENINYSIKSLNDVKIVQMINNFSRNHDMPLNLINFTKVYNVDLSVLYKGRTWNSLCNSAGITTNFSRFNPMLSRAVYKKWLSVDSFSYFTFIENLSTNGFKVDYNNFSPKEKLLALMFYYDLFQNENVYGSLQDMFDALSNDQEFAEEISQIMFILKSNCKVLEECDNSVLKNSFPLMLHAQYTKDEIFVALRTSSLEKKSTCREGVERNKAMKIEAMFVDIIKDREAGSNTNYNDYAISNDLFHWETQNKVSPESPAGLNYINQTQTMLLFVRQQQTFPDDSTRTMGYVYLGQVFLKSYSGSKPMQIIWKLKDPIPASVSEYAISWRSVG